MKRWRHRLIWPVRLAHRDNRIADANFRVVNGARRILRAEDLLGVKRPLEEIDHLGRTLRMQIWREVVHPLGQRLGVLAMGRDIPLIAEWVFDTRLAGAVILVGGLMKRSRTGFERTRI